MRTHQTPLVATLLTSLALTSLALTSFALAACAGPPLDDDAVSQEEVVAGELILAPAAELAPPRPSASLARARAAEDARRTRFLEASEDPATSMVIRGHVTRVETGFAPARSNGEPEVVTGYTVRLERSWKQRGARELTLWSRGGRFQGADGATHELHVSTEIYPEIGEEILVAVAESSFHRVSPPLLRARNGHLGAVRWTRAGGEPALVNEVTADLQRSYPSFASME
ncbi:MAG: hypothetical protein IT384_21510 [Deltaproteobacteria bacterium]|nr:hypothetical protein [Deltaproteobacteria bacterium]